MNWHYLKLKPGSSSVHIWADEAWVPADQELSPVPQPSLTQTWGIDFLFNVQWPKGSCSMFCSPIFIGRLWFLVLQFFLQLPFWPSLSHHYYISTVQYLGSVLSVYIPLTSGLHMTCKMDFFFKVQCFATLHPSAWKKVWGMLPRINTKGAPKSHTDLDGS